MVDFNKLLDKLKKNPKGETEMDQIDEVHNKLKEAGVNVSKADIKTRFDLMKGFGVQDSEINRSIFNYYARESGIAISTFYAGGDNPEVKVDTLNKPDMWGSVRVKVIQLWDSNHESVGQVGLAGDDSGTIKFTKWASADLPPMEEDHCYLIQNVVTSEYNGRMQISLNKKSKIELTNDEIEVGYATMTVIGALVHIQDGSGLIKRCPDCNRSLRMGVCSEHGKVDGTFDIRIKGSIDDGVDSHPILLTTELTSQITGMDLDTARKIATEALDQSVVLDEFKKRLLCKFYIVEGSQMDRFILTESISPLSEISQQDIMDLQDAIPKVVE